MSRRHEKIETGIYVVHATACEGEIEGRSCRCKPTYQAMFWDGARQRTIKKHFDTKQLARGWREDLRSAARAGRTITAPSRTTVADAVDEYIAGMEDGSILNRSNVPYKPSSLRTYRRAAERLKAQIGHMRLTDLRRRDLNAMVERMRADGVSASTISNTIDPLRVVFQRALDNELVAVDPTHKLRLPSRTADAQERKSVSPAQAERLITALPEDDQALWAMAIYIGLRRGELQELRWSDLDLDAGTGRCERAWDDEGGQVVTTKSRAGTRTFPLPDLVIRRLRTHRLRTGRRGGDLVLGRTAVDRFIPSTVRRRARAAWKIAELEPITLHEGRHSAATSGARAGLDDLMLSGIMGHSSVTITKDRYGHVRDDHVASIKEQIDTYLEGATDA